MTLHWWMHWFWVTFIHSVVAFPLLVPGTLSAPSQEELHGIQSPVSSPPTAPGEDKPWGAEEVSPVRGKDLLGESTAVEKVAEDNGRDSPTATIEHEGKAYVSTEGSVIGKEQASSAIEVFDKDGENTSESSKDVPLFLEEEGEQGWGLDDPAPRPPFFLQSADLGEVYEEEEEDEGIHASAGMPWLPGAVPRVEIDSSSERPTIIPSHEPPSSTVEPWPANRNPDDSVAGESHSDVSEGGENGGRGPREQPQQPNPEPNINSTPLPEAIVTSEAPTTPSPIWTLYSSSPSYSSYTHSSPPPSSSYTLSSSPSPLYTDSSSPSPSHITPTAISDIPPTLSSFLIPSDTLSSDAVHVREGKAIGVNHIDQQPKQEQKQVEVMVGSNETASTTLRPTKFDVESSPVKSSPKLNATAVVSKEDEVRKENITLDSSGPVIMESSHSNLDEKEENVGESGDIHSPPIIKEEIAKQDEDKGLIGSEVEKEPESINIDSPVVDKSDSDQGKPTQEEELTSPVEVPTAVAVREGGASVESAQPEEKKERDGDREPPKKVDREPITTAADVPSSVQQGRMTAPRSLDAASIVGISLGSVLLVGAVAGGIAFVLYRRSLYANKPQTLNDKCSNPDSSGYIDDTLRVSSTCPPPRGPRPTPRSRVEVTRSGGQERGGGGRGGEGGRQRRPSGAKENSEEMYSLDNDSFLNSLEAMTIQNYWTDSVKHTKL